MKKTSTSAPANKKRKLPHDDDDDDEEENMEKFYALINSIREARVRSTVNKGAAAPAQDESETKTRKVVEEDDDQDKLVSAWKPSFRREDFMEDQSSKLKKLPCASLGSTSQSKEGVGVDDDDKDKDRKEEVKEELDLNLSL